MHLPPDSSHTFVSGAATFCGGLSALDHLLFGRYNEVLLGQGPDLLGQGDPAKKKWYGATAHPIYL